MVSPAITKGLEQLHSRMHRREMVHPDPLEFLYAYPDPRDREIVGLVAAGLAYGRVAQILKSVARALDLLPEPAEFLKNATEESLQKTFRISSTGSRRARSFRRCSSASSARPSGSGR